MHKPYSPACDRNQEGILTVLRRHVADRAHVLEIGSGTGQHAVHFAAALPQVVWQTSDVPAHLPGIRRWLADARLRNTPEPLAFDINGTPPAGTFDGVFSANTLHIMGWPEVEKLFATLPGLTSADAVLVVYGPFKYGGEFTSASNGAFDVSLRIADPQRGIRDFEAVDALAAAAGFGLIEDADMPAHNRCVVWQRTA